MPLTRSVSVYENQRYSPVSGFSAKGLLIGDRGALSNEEGTIRYSRFTTVILISVYSLLYTV